MGRAARRTRDRRDKVSRVPPELRAKTEREFLDEAVAHAKDGRRDEAEEMLDVAVLVHPKAPALWYALGTMRLTRGDAAGALEALSESLDLDHENPDALRGLADAMVTLERHEEAEDALRAAIALEPAEPAQWFLLGVIYDQIEELSMAALAYGEAVRLAPQEAAAHWHLANVLWFLERADEAEARFKEAIRVDPSVPEAHSGLGVMLLDLGRHGEAEVALREALRLEPREWPSAAALAQALAHQGRRAEAEQQMAAAEALAPAEDEEAQEVIAGARARLKEALGGPPAE